MHWHVFTRLPPWKGILYFEYVGYIMYVCKNSLTKGIPFQKFSLLITVGLDHWKIYNFETKLTTVYGWGKPIGTSTWGWHQWKLSTKGYAFSYFLSHKGYDFPHISVSQRVQVWTFLPHKPTTFRGECNLFQTYFNFYSCSSIKQSVCQIIRVPLLPAAESQCAAHSSLHVIFTLWILIEHI